MHATPSRSIDQTLGTPSQRRTRLPYVIWCSNSHPTRSCRARANPPFSNGSWWQYDPVFWRTVAVSQSVCRKIVETGSDWFQTIVLAEDLFRLFRPRNNHEKLSNCNVITCFADSEGTINECPGLGETRPYITRTIIISMTQS